MPGTTSDRFNVADILATEVSDGEVRANIGFVHTGKGIGASEAMWWGADGFISRPNDPDDDGACMTWFFADGNDRRLLAYRDNRFADKVGEMKAGDRAIISSGEARLLLKTQNDSITLFSASQPNDDEAMMVSLDGEAGEVTISCAGSFFKMSNDKITIGVAGGATIVTIDKDGFQIDGKSFRCATSSGHLGILAPLVPPTQATALCFVPLPPNPPIIPALATPAKGWTISPGSV